jgi:hypothetical protein
MQEQYFSRRTPIAAMQYEGFIRMRVENFADAVDAATLHPGASGSRHEIGFPRCMAGAAALSSHAGSVLRCREPVERIPPVRRFSGGVQPA